MLEFNHVKISWLGHASFRIEKEITLYIDPYQLKPHQPKADLILITHDHYDHCSQKDIDGISKEDTLIIGPEKAVKQLKGNTRIIKPGDTIKIKNVLIKAVHAYNLNKPFHPKGIGVGYIITIDGVKIYHAGDTDLIPEMDVITADIALLPVGGTYTMNALEAAQAANKIKPTIAIPMHYAKIVGTKEDAILFSRKAQCEVRILEPE